MMFSLVRLVHAGAKSSAPDRLLITLVKSPAGALVQRFLKVLAAYYYFCSRGVGRGRPAPTDPVRDRPAPIRAQSRATPPNPHPRTMSRDIANLRAKSAQREWNRAIPHDRMGCRRAVLDAAHMQFGTNEIDLIPTQINDLANPQTMTRGLLCFWSWGGSAACRPAWTGNHNDNKRGDHPRKTVHQRTSGRFPANYQYLGWCTPFCTSLHQLHQGTGLCARR
jgi:hypothetical protein